MNVENERQVMAALLASTELWPSAENVVPQCFSGTRRALFVFMRRHYERYGDTIPPKALGNAVKADTSDEARQRAIVAEYFRCRRIKPGGEWEMDELVKAYRTSEFLKTISASLEALQGVVTAPDGKKYVGVDGAYEMLGIDETVACAVDGDIDPFSVYLRRKAGGDVFSLPLLSGVAPDPQLGELWTLAGYTGEGKTSLALNLVESATRAGVGTVIVSMEGGSHVPYWKMASLLSESEEGPRLPYGEIKRAALDEEKELHLKKLLEISKQRVRVIGAPVGTGPRRIRQIVKREMRKRPVQLVMVDYSKLMVLRDSRDEDYLGSCIRRLKGVATELNVVVLMMHQTNTRGWEEAGKLGYYKLSALAETAEVQRNSDAIIWILRTGYLQSSIGLVKYRDEPFDIGSSHDISLDGEIGRFIKGSIVPRQGADGESGPGSAFEGTLPID